MSDNETKNSKGKSLIIAYLLWLIGGVAGLHHYYLGRDLHGFLWLCTLGGYFGCGWIRDVFHINEYVAQANGDKNYLKKIKEIVKKNKKVGSLTGNRNDQFSDLYVFNFTASFFYYSIHWNGTSRLLLELPLSNSYSWRRIRRYQLEMVVFIVSIFQCFGWVVVACKNLSISSKF